MLKSTTFTTALLIATTTLATGCFDDVTEPEPEDRVSALSDEFDAATLDDSWLRLYITEGWQANQIETTEIQDGGLMLVPHTTAWFDNYRGPLLFKEAEGDFVVTVRVQISNRAGDGLPRSAFSLAGILVRNPRPISSPADWTYDGENYVFLGFGNTTQDDPDIFIEAKSTTNGYALNDDQMFTNISDEDTRELRIARIQSNFILLYRDAGSWIVLERYTRPDFEDTLQVGITAYSDFCTLRPETPPFCQLEGPIISAPEYNATTITTGNPDLIARFDYVRLTLPDVPSALQGTSLQDVNNTTLLEFLGFD